MRNTLCFTDEELAELYSKWSEDTYCAGWICDGEEEFADYLIYTEKLPRESLPEWKRESVKKIRAAIYKRLFGVEGIP